MSQLDEIRAKIDIVELIGALGVSLRKTGRSYVGYCPFHPNTRTPAFTVYPESQSFYCFGCHAAGTAFDFVMRKQGLDFKSALEQLAARAGVKLVVRGEVAREEDAQRVKLLEINTLAARVFQHVLINTPRGEPARAYIAKRELDAASIESFQLGFSPDEWNFLFDYLTEKKGYAPEEVEAAGLVIHHESGRYYDRFRGRLMFPIRNAKGQVVGFGGRALGDATPKYLNTPETLLYKKGELLYGLDLARETIRLEDRTVVVEGYLDVITAHQHGFHNVVAPLGTALTKAHSALLKRLSHNVYMALDADPAGQRATLKGLNALRESDDAEGRLVATAQGSVRLESEVALRIIRMPAGRDPDEVIKADPEHWRRLVAEAVPVMAFYLETFTAGLDFTQPEAQRQALERLVPLLQELDEAGKRAYATQIAHVVGMRADMILSLLGQGQLQAFRTSIAKRIPVDAGPDQKARPLPKATSRELERQQGRRKVLTPEGYLLALALRHPKLDTAIATLLETGLAQHPRVRELFGGGLENLLAEPTYQELWRQFLLMPLEWRPSTPEGLQAWAAGLAEPLRDEALRLIAHPGRSLEDIRYRQEAEHCARSLCASQARQLQRRLLQRLVDEHDDDRSETLARLGALTEFLATNTTPRRCNTYLDLRDVLGQQ